MSESNFTRPASNLANDALGYAGAQLDNLKLRSVRALSNGTGTIFWVAVVLILVSILLLTLSFALVMWLGEKLGSYALGGFIVAGGILVLLVLVLLLRKALFKGTFLSTFSKAFFPNGDKIRNENDLEKAMLRNELNISKQETLMARSYGDAKQFYANPRLFVDGIGTAVDWVSSFFSKDKKAEPEKAAAASKPRRKAKKDKAPEAEAKAEA